jgi:hypothetical protein
MRCYKCDGTYLEKSDLFEIVDPYVGPISVQGIPYFKCNQCDDVLFTAEMAQALEEARNKRKQELLNQFPIGDFISASETASLLDISRQALHKNRRIRRGFIHQTTFGGAIVYLKKSVIQFKKTGDGRFPLCAAGHYIPAKYLESITLLDMTGIHSFHFPLMARLHAKPYFESTLTRLEKNSYAK